MNTTWRKKVLSEKKFPILPCPEFTTFPFCLTEYFYMYICICYILHAGGGTTFWHEDRNYCLHYSSSTLCLMIFIFYGFVCMYLSKPRISFIHQCVICVELYLTTCTTNWSLFYSITCFQNLFFLNKLRFFSDLSNCWRSPVDTKTKKEERFYRHNKEPKKPNNKSTLQWKHIHPSHLQASIIYSNRDSSNGNHASSVPSMFALPCFANISQTQSYSSFLVLIKILSRTTNLFFFCPTVLTCR